MIVTDLFELAPEQDMLESNDQQLDELGWKDLGSKIFGSSPNTTAAPGSLSPRFSAHIPNPATCKPYTQAELRALAAQKAPPATAPASASAPPATAPASASAPSVANVPAGYSKVTQSFKKPSPTPATPNPAGTIGTYNKKTGVATLAFKDLPPNIQKQLAGITEALAQPVAELLQMVETKEDVQRIKQFVDQTFVKHGAVNESAFTVRNQILEHVTQVGAQRRRDFAAQQTH